MSSRFLDTQFNSQGETGKLQIGYHSVLTVVLCAAAGYAAIEISHSELHFPAPALKEKAIQVPLASPRTEARDRLVLPPVAQAPAIANIETLAAPRPDRIARRLIKRTHPSIAGGHGHLHFRPIRKLNPIADLADLAALPPVDLSVTGTAVPGCGDSKRADLTCLDEQALALDKVAGPNPGVPSPIGSEVLASALADVRISRTSPPSATAAGMPNSTDTSPDPLAIYSQPAPPPTSAPPVAEIQPDISPNPQTLADAPPVTASGQDTTAARPAVVEASTNVVYSARPSQSISRISQVRDGIQIEVSTLVNSTPSGKLSVLIAGADIRHPEYTSDNFTVLLSDVIQLLKSRMSEKLYSELMSSSNSQQYVTFNDLRSHGISVSFDHHDRLLLKVS